MLTGRQQDDFRNLVLYGQEDREEACRRLLIYVESLNKMSQVKLLEELETAGASPVFEINQAASIGRALRAKLTELREENP